MSDKENIEHVLHAGKFGLTLIRMSTNTTYGVQDSGDDGVMRPSDSALQMLRMCIYDSLISQNVMLKKPRPEVGALQRPCLGLRVRECRGCKGNSRRRLSRPRNHETPGVGLD